MKFNFYFSVARFLGVGEIDEGTKERYRQRREKCYRTDLKCQGDEVDFGRKSCVGRKECKPRKRESLFQIVGKAVVRLQKLNKKNFDSFDSNILRNNMELNICPEDIFCSSKNKNACRSLNK